MKPDRCQATANSGKPCSASPRPGRPFCLWHDDAAAAERRAISRKGGEARSNRARARKQYADGALTPVEVEGLIGDTIHGVISGKLEPGVGNAVANLARAAMAVREAADFEAALADMRREIADLRGAS